MKLAIIGSGNVGGALGKLWAEKGHAVDDVDQVGSHRTALVTLLVERTVPALLVAQLRPRWVGVTRRVAQLEGLVVELEIDVPRAPVLDSNRYR